MKKLFLTFSIGILLMFIAILNSCNTGNPLGDYKGIAFTDEAYKIGVQVIPGEIQCEYYDLGGEGVSYHDSDSINSGSGNYNPANGSYLHEFRLNESVDISYAKSDGIDDNPYNLVHPEMDQLYIGWTNPGEWTKYTIDVKTPGLYQVGIMYTAHDNGQISLSINDTDITGPLDILSTYVATDTLSMRQWHHWNYLDNIAQIELQKGLQTLTLHTVVVGQMNYDYLNFSIIK
ncbi:MAG: carbohydrate-binding protein [Bacteroidales bacterium]|nr:carbohydrate-binding protein [Bacteroidales bacterium]